MTVKTLLISAAFVLLPAAQTVSAQEISRGWGVGTITYDRAPSGVSNPFYTQVRIEAVDVSFPSDPNRRKELIRALLAAFSASSRESREIAVTAKVTSGGITLPEVTLFSYRVDGRENTITKHKKAEVRFPYHYLEPAESIRVEIGFSDVVAANYSIMEAANSLGSMIPGTAILNATSKPFVERLTGIGSAVFSNLHTRKRLDSTSLVLSPYGTDAKKASVPLADPRAVPLGTINISLWGSPSVQREMRLVGQAQVGDDQHRPSEDPFLIKQDIAGTQTPLLPELWKLDSARALLSDKTNLDRIRTYCREAGTRLSADWGLTTLDRLNLLYGSMLELGYSTDRERSYGWLNSCFVGDDYLGVIRAFGLDPTPPALESANQLGKERFWALGCWSRAVTEDRCKAESPNSEGVLTEFFADKVDVAIDSRFMDIDSLGDLRAVPASKLIPALKGRADRFTCLKDSSVLLITSGDDVYLLEGRKEKRKLVQLAIRKVAKSERECN